MERVAIIVSPHPDDAEIGMGGTIAALVSSGCRAIIADLTNGEPTPYGTPEKRAQEARTAAEILGVEREQIGITNREVFDTVENRKKLASVYRKYKPGIVFVPYWEDAHPDHWQGCTLGEAARFYSKFVKCDMPFEAHYPARVFHYFACHLRAKFQPSFIFDISAHIDKKLAAISAYRSQFLDNPLHQGIVERIRGESAHWGVQGRTTYGEPFICRENIRLSSADGLFNA